MVLPVPGYPTAPGRFATEAPFAEHLRLLRRSLGPLAKELTVAGPGFTEKRYRAIRSQCEELSEEADGIRFRPIYPVGLGRLGYWKRLPQTFHALVEEVKRADTVHAGNSQLFRPFEFPALVLAQHLNKTTVSVTDIDHRLTPQMKRAIGEWSLREYWWTELVHQKWFHLQQSYAARNFSLVLLKGRALAKDYGSKRDNVHFFLDSAFSDEHIIPEARLKRKLEQLEDANQPLRVVYFGRLVPRKGVDRMLRAVHQARAAGASLRFRIIGDGSSGDLLRGLTSELALDDVVTFVGSVPFGPALFEELYEAELLLAAPLAQDTPRSALDAAAAAVPTLAFDTYYYNDLAALGACVRTVRWPDEKAMGAALTAIAKSRPTLGRQMKQAVAFASQNTQEMWLKRRASWTQSAPECGDAISGQATTEA